jgi:hypothetical protein
LTVRGRNFLIEPSVRAKRLVSGCRPCGRARPRRASTRFADLEGETAGPPAARLRPPRADQPDPVKFPRSLERVLHDFVLRVPSEVCTLRRVRYLLCADLRPTEGKPMCRSVGVQEGWRRHRGRLNGYRPFRPRTAAVGVERVTGTPRVVEALLSSDAIDTSHARGTTTISSTC